MPSVAPRPEPVRIGNISAQPKTGVGGAVTHWEIYNERVRGAIASLTPEEWQAEGTDMVAAYAAGKPYVRRRPRQPYAGRNLTADERAIEQTEIFQNGADATRGVGAWSRYLGREEIREGGMLASSLDAAPPEQWPAVVRELFGGLYGLDDAVPLESPPPGTEWIGKLHETANALPEWRELQETAGGDPWRAGIAAAKIADELARVLKDELKNTAPPEDPVRLNAEADALAELGAADTELGKQAAEKATGAMLAAARMLEALEGAPEQAAVQQAIAAGAAEALAELDGMDEAMAGLSAGTGSAELQVCSSSAKEIRDALARNPTLKRIASLAGRLRMSARKAQRSRTRYVPEQIVDVTLGGEIARLVPSELMQLADPDFELVLARKVLERTALQYELEGTEQLDRGPIIVCVDNSGSMGGTPHEWAMAVALALLEVAAIQRRQFALVHFDSRVQKVFEVPKPRKLTIAELEAMVCFFSGGGTDFGPPLRAAHGMIAKNEKWKRSDVILVTDGQAGWGNAPELLRQVDAALYGIAIGATWSPAQKPELAAAIELPALQVRDGSANVDVVFGI